jgi:hypothetical protein
MGAAAQGRAGASRAAAGEQGRAQGKKKGGGGREREGKGRGKTHLWGSKFQRSRLQTLGHHGGEREVEEGEGGYCAGEIK